VISEKKVFTKIQGPNLFQAGGLVASKVISPILSSAKLFDARIYRSRWK